MLASLPQQSPRSPFLIALVLAALMLMAGCDRDDADPSQDDERLASAVEEDEQGDGASADPYVARGGPISLTLEDVEIAVNRLRLMAPSVQEGEIPTDEPEWMQYPRAQIDMLNNLVQFAVIRHVAAERELEVSEQRFNEFLGEHPTLQRYLPLFTSDDGEDSDENLEALRAELATVGLDKSDVRHLVEDILLLEALDEELSRQFSDDDLWGVYQNAYDQGALVVATTRNTPTSEELDRAMRQYDKEIRAYYRENRDRFVTSLQLWATTIGPEEPGEFEGDELKARLEEAAQRLADGDAPEAVADEMGFLVQPRVYLHRRDHPTAQEAQIGHTGVSLNPRVAVAWRLDEREEAAPRTLDRPLRREIAATIIREEEGITPANRARAQQARDILAGPEAGQALDEAQITGLIEALEEAGFDATFTDLFSLRTGGAIPTIGLAENLLDATRQADLDDPIIDPLLDRQVVHTARLVDRRHPDREAFEEELDDFRAEFMERNKGRMVQRFVAEFREKHGIQIARNPLVERYGVAEKPAPQ